MAVHDNEWRPIRIRLLGVPVDLVTMDQALDVVDQMVRGRAARSIIAVNPEKIIRSGNDPDLLQALNAAGLLIPDGIGAVWAARILGLGTMDRVPGAELMPAICARSVHRGYRLFLYGARPETNRRAVEELRRQYPGIRIVGHRDGYVSADDMPALVDEINRSGAQILFIALGSPAQEVWMKTWFPMLETVRVCQGVGGTFDVIAGTVRRAPPVFRKLNLEWFYRLMSEPGRILRQTSLPVFAWRVLKEKFLVRGRQA